MTNHAADLAARFEKFQRDRRDLEQSLNFLVETNREMTAAVLHAIEQPRALPDARTAAQRQTEKMGTCVQGLVLLLREHEDTLRALRDTLADMRRALS